MNKGHAKLQRREGGGRMAPSPGVFGQFLPVNSGRSCPESPWSTEPFDDTIVSGDMQVVSRSYIAYRTALALIVGAGVGIVGAAATPAGWTPGIAVFLLVLALSLRKPVRRLNAVRGDLPAGSRAWLERCVPLYRGLEEEARVRFENDMKIVLDEWTYEGVDDVEVTTEMRIGVAAGAALLLHGRPDWELPRHQTVLFYPDRFDSDYMLNDDAAYDGMAHQHGPIILSSVALEESWEHTDDANNVVLHELAHLLDYKNEFADGVPSLVDPGSTVAWQDLVRKEMWRIRHRRSLLRGYGATNPAEFFAVAVENFFERPELMAERHPELFAALEALFNLDPRTAEQSLSEDRAP